MSNYDIDSDVLKPEHVAFLTSKVAPILAGRRARLFMQGSASSTGTAAHNLALSRRRADNVAAFLQTQGVAASQMQIDAVGEGLASTKIPENSDDRAVALLAAPLFDPPRPKPQQPKPAGTPRVTSFRIRMLGGLSGGEVATIEQLFFEIVDPANKLSSIYVYSGIGKGGGTPISVTLRGPFNDFKTSGPVAVDEFGGPARFTTGGAGSISSNHLNMMSMPRGTKTIPNPLSLSTGFTVGAGVSTTVGTMILQLTAPFTGP